MIDFIHGQFVYAGAEYIAVEVNGVGYQVHVTNPFAWEEGEHVLLYTHMIVREDVHLLYGFSSKEERDLFRLLLEVSGIGPKAGIAMMAGGTPHQLVSAIQMEDLKYLTRLPGIGKKTAQRIVLELKDKLKKLGWEHRFGPSLIEAERHPSPTATVGSAERDVIDALVGLGYNEEEAEWAVREAWQQADSESLSTEAWIKRALQVSMRK